LKNYVSTLLSLNSDRLINILIIHIVDHLSQINHNLKPAFVPSPSSIPVYFVRANGEKVPATLSTLASVAAQQEKGQFANDELTVYITGLPRTSPTVEKATKALIQAYMQRYNIQVQRKQLQGWEYEEGKNKQQQKERTSSEEDYSESWKEGQSTSGNLIIIDLGSVLTSFKRLAMLDIEQTGVMIAKAMIQMCNQLEIPEDIFHIVGQGIAAHVAGAAGNEYTRLTGRRLRRITALDPSKIFARSPNTLTSLTRGDADFVDAIHTSAYGMGTPMEVGNVDFYPNGPSAGVPGAANVVEASMRATRFFAESVRPGNERNFPAVPANSLNEYQGKNGIGKRAYMGINVDFDLEGDYMLQVNPMSPFGQRSPATKQTTYHGVHKQAWNNASDM